MKSDHFVNFKPCLGTMYEHNPKYSTKCDLVDVDTSVLTGIGRKPSGALCNTSTPISLVTTLNDTGNGEGEFGISVNSLMQMA